MELKMDFTWRSSVSKVFCNKIIKKKSFEKSYSRLQQNESRFSLNLTKTP